TTGIIKITSCRLEYNHEIHPDTIIFASNYRQFPDEAKEDIKYYTSKGLNMRMQLSILEDKYPGTLFLPQQRNKVDNKASILLEKLLNNKARGVQSTQWVKNINAIIKTTLTSKTGLCELVSVLNNRFAKKSLFIRYYKWSESHMKPTSVAISTKLLLEVDKWLAEFLTPPILSLQRTEIAEVLWYNLTLIPKENLFTLPIKEIWKVIRYRATHKNYIIAFEDGTHICTCLQLVNQNNNYSKSYKSLKSEPSISYQNACTILVSNSILNLSSTYYNLNFDNQFNNTMLKILNFYREYGIMNGLCKKAISVGLEASYTAIDTLNKFFEDFIRKHSINQHISTN
ncbi:27548_t:CDS:2, partial [Gigaspora margarita]